MGFSFLYHVVQGLTLTFTLIGLVEQYLQGFVYSKIEESTGLSMFVCFLFSFFFFHIWSQEIISVAWSLSYNFIFYFLFLFVCFLFSVETSGVLQMSIIITTIIQTPNDKSPIVPLGVLILNYYNNRNQILQISLSPST